MTAGLALALLSMVVLLGVGNRFVQGAARTRIAQWGQLAARYKLTFQEDPDPYRSTLRGLYHGVPVSIALGTSRVGLPLRLSTVLRMELSGGAPAGLEILPRRLLRGAAMGALPDEIPLGSEPLDRAIRVRGQERTRTLQVVNDPAVSAALLLGLQRSDYLRVTDRAVELERRGIVGAELGDLLEIGGVLAAAISESGDRPWRATASRFALGYSGATATGTRCLQGAVDGLKVLVIESPPGAGRSAQSRVQVSLPVRAAASLRVLQRLDVLGAAGANPTDAQIGDSLAVDCKDAEFVNQLFAEPEVVKRLTALYRRWPGTRIEGGRVQVLRDGTFGLEMIETLTLLLEFGRFFRDAMVEADLARRAEGG